MASKSWIEGNDVLENLETFSTLVQSWNKTVLGNIFEKKRIKMKELERVQRALERRFSIRLDLREKSFRFELENILNQEELFWLQKSCSELFWLQKSRVSSHQMEIRILLFFHRRTLKRRRQNKIETLMVDESSWCFDDEILQKHVINYFSRLYTIDAYSMGPFLVGG